MVVMEKMQQKAALKSISDYSSVTSKAIYVLVRILPVQLIVEECVAVYREVKKVHAR